MRPALTVTGLLQGSQPVQARLMSSYAAGMQYGEDPNMQVCVRHMGPTHDGSSAVSLAASTSATYLLLIMWSIRATCARQYL